MDVLSNLSNICDEHLMDNYSIEVIDAAARPDLAAKDGVAIVPTLLRVLPHPVKKLGGALDDADLLLTVLGLGPYAGSAAR
jgi:circadian clock protein KaiB